MPKEPTKKLAIIDSFALLFRAWHAIPNLTSKDGTMINAVYGFTSILLKLITEIHPDYLVAAFDLPQETFRHKEYKLYKANREAPDKAFIAQISMAEKVLKGLNIPVMAVPGYEADDVIGSLSRHIYAEHPDIDVIIVSGDNDTLQLVNDRVKVFTMRKGINDTLIYDEDGVRERYSLRPNQLIDYKGLRGDTSDNIPGVKGIGEKGATELLKNFGTLDGIYKNIASDKISDRIRNLLKDQEAMARQSKMLATIVVDLPVDLDLKKSSITNYDAEKAAAVFQEFEFRSLLSKLPKQGTQMSLVAPAAKKQSSYYDAIATPDEIESFATELKKHKEFALDTETTGLNPRQDKLLGASFSWEKGKATFIHLRDKKSLAAFKQYVGPILANANYKKIGHNIKFDMAVLANNEMPMQGISMDTIIAAYLINAGRGLKLEELVFSYVGKRMDNLAELAERHGAKNKSEIDVAAIPLDALAQYGAADADFCLQLARKLEPELKHEKVETVLTDIDLPLIPVLCAMEANGIAIDIPYLKIVEKDLAKQLAVLEKKIYKMAGKEFNVNSPLQLKEILFDTLKIDTKGIKRKKTGLSTAAAELEKMKDLHPIIPLIGDHREIAKLLNTYVRTLPEQVDPTDHRIHTNYSQTIAATGRLSSIDPNLQNIPIRTELGRTIRQAFIAKPGCILLSADYSQIELRLAAVISKDKKMLASFKAGEDIHRRTAAEIHGVALADVTADQRRSAKEVNFGVLYGLGSTGLAQRTGMSRFEAKQFIEKYFDLYQGVKQYINDTKDFARANGYVTTLYGRKRKLPEIQSTMPQLIAQGERMAVNMPLQGTAADIMKLAMIAVAKELPKKHKEVKMLLQVHDELVCEVPADDMKSVAKILKQTMEGVADFPIPLTVDVKQGNNWAEMKPVGL